MVYVDDTIIFAKDQKIISNLITSLEKDFVLTDEGDVQSFLGVKVRKFDDNSIELTQPTLINIFLKLLNLDKESKMHDTPAIARPQDYHTAELPREESWNYRSAIGQLNYIAMNTRPDISAAVHQCARFTCAPKKFHEEAVKRIGRYLLRTKTKGIILKPDKTKTTLDCYVDADFAGNWNTEDGTNPASVTSRTCFVLIYFSCPVLWSSKLQSEIALSTTEAEYIALSTAMRDLIPMKQLLSELQTVLKIPAQEITCHSILFEDNVGAETIANVPKMRPRTKHIAIKYHHFREHVKNKTILVTHVDTHDQLADIFTKPLPRDTFRTLRYQLQGW